MVDEFDKYKKFGMRTNSKSFKNWYNSGLLRDIDENLIEETEKYWKNKTDLKIRPTLHLAFKSLTNRSETRLVPTNVMNYEVLPIFNDYNMTTFYSDKNIYDLIIKPSKSAVTVLRSINGKYFDADYNTVDLAKAFELLSDTTTDMIIKPSLSNNGTGISILTFRNDKIFVGDEETGIKELLLNYGGNFIIQEVLKQHPIMAAPHPSSVNTIRMVTFRWKNEIHYLLAFARFGSGEDIRDNANVDSSPRIGIKDSGEFYNFGIGQSGERFTEHPTTGFDLTELEPVPNYDKFKEFVKESHKNFLHLDLISWDIAVGIDGHPVFIEANFAGSTSFYQLVSQRSIFGDMTDEVMDHVQKKLNKNRRVMMKKHQIKRNNKFKNKLKKKNENSLLQVKRLESKISLESDKIDELKRLKNKVQRMQKKKDRVKADDEKYTLLKEMNYYKRKCDDMENSTSWRLTTPVRQVKSLFKK